MNNTKEKSAVGMATPATEKEKSAVGMAVPATEKQNSTTEIITCAVKKVKPPANIKNRYAKAIAEPVSQALQEFCRQEEEFACAVLDGGNIEECIDSIVKKITGKQAVSDLDVYQAAVEYYFPGAVIQCRMTVHMSEYEIESGDPEQKSGIAEHTDQKPEKKKSIDLSLDSLLDW